MGIINCNTPIDDSDIIEMDQEKLEVELIMLDIESILHGNVIFKHWHGKQFFNNTMILMIYKAHTYPDESDVDESTKEGDLVGLCMKETALHEIMNPNMCISMELRWKDSEGPKRDWIGYPTKAILMLKGHVHQKKEKTTWE